MQYPVNYLIADINLETGELESVCPSEITIPPPNLPRKLRRKWKVLFEKRRKVVGDYDAAMSVTRYISRMKY